MSDPCAQCDFIGPLGPDEQNLRELHRAWHELGRTWRAGVEPIVAAFRSVSAAASTTTAALAALPTPEEPMNAPITPPEIWRVEPHDDVTLHRKGGVIGGRVVRVQVGGRGTALYLYGRGLPYWVGNGNDTWTLAEHRPAIPPVMHVGARYHVMTADELHFQAYWSPIDGIRANHPWLHPDGQTRTRSDVVVRARLADYDEDDL